ncbi:serine/threonine protein kinase [Roseimicrobium gellanilyticum]|uniref:Serine/threonine protein kinase n=1 Tax=Roseimicrobium gellanilyticum TaxID=748857 RepID=A0A366HSN9_9BACT|nr:serine/threonine-protein kinase [Roseimicrobium gellanilyticum]RBP46516.1 serine/threonine protein kinase [Roseimicrobium gellanilyticum]
MELPLPEELSQLLPEGEYIVENFLGQGGMGAVYQGLQMPLKRPVAIKILQRRRTEDDYHFEDRFRREAYSMATLIHPNVVQVYDCGDAGEDFLFISMELVEGGDLSQAMRHGQLTLASALQMLIPICEGVQAAHEHGLVHRDIKPANIFLTMDSRPKVADFGLAKRCDAHTTFVTQAGLGMGTPDYAAPEQYEECADLDHRVDIYSLGVMFYQMLTGHLPRGAYKLASRLVQVDTRLDVVLQKAMENDRVERYQSVEQLKVDMQHILTTWMAPPRPRVIMQTGRVVVGNGHASAMTGRVPTMTGRVPTMTGRVPTMAGHPSTMTGRVPTIAKPTAPHPTPPVPRVVPIPTPQSSYHVVPVPKKRSGVPVVAGLLALLLLGGSAAFLTSRHSGPSAATAASSANLAKTDAVSTSSGTASSSVSVATGSKSEASADGPSILPTLPPLQRLDLLALTDPVRDRVSTPPGVDKNEWARVGSALMYRSDGRSGKLVAPVSFECRDYEIEFRAERSSGNGRIHVDLPLATGRILPLILNDPTSRILNEKEGASWPRNASVVHAIIRVVRRRGGEGEDRLVIRDAISGRELLNWRGRFGPLGRAGESHPEIDGKAMASLFVPSDSYVIQMWQLTVFEGRAVRLRAPDTGAAGQPVAQVSQAASSIPPASENYIDAGSSPAPFPATIQADARLLKLESGFQSRRESDAQKPFTTAMATLNAGYVRALAAARKTAEKQGNSSHVALLDEESARTKAGTPPPDADAPGTPEPLLKLRSTYRAEVAKYLVARDKADAVLYDIYLGALDSYVEELARNKDARVREVQEVRRQIAARKPAVRN